jgi:nitroreductase
VPEKLVQDLLVAAIQAHSAGNQQPLHFILMTSHKQLNALAGELPYSQNLQSAALDVGVCTDLILK